MPIDIDLATDGTMHITDLTQRTIGVYGVKGAGKTYTIAVILEELANQGARYVFLDPIGALAKKEREGERKAPKREAYLKKELTGENGAKIAETICDPNLVAKGVSFHLDLSGMTQPDRIAFVEALSETLLLCNQEDLIFIADEVQNFAPSKPMKGQSVGHGHFMRLCAEGRNRNIGLIIASQRTAKVNADLRELVDVMVFHKMIGSLSIDAAEEMLKHHVEDPDELDQLLKSIKELGTGEIYLYDPSAINPSRNGEKGSTQETNQVQGQVRKLGEAGEVNEPDGDEAPAEPAEEEEEVEVEGKATSIPAGNLPPPPARRVPGVERFDRDLALGKACLVRWEAGEHGEFEAFGKATRILTDEVEVQLSEEVPAGKSVYPVGHVIRVPRYGKQRWTATNGVFAATARSPGDPSEVAAAAEQAALEQGLHPSDAEDVADAAEEAAAGQYEVVAETKKGKELARAALEESGHGDHDAPAFRQRIVATEPAAAQTHMSKHGEPGDEVTVDDDYTPEQLHPVAVHEWVEENAMRKGLSQREAHQVANAAERVAAGDEVFEEGVQLAQAVSQKAQREAGMAWVEQPSGHYESGKAEGKRDSNGVTSYIECPTHGTRLAELRDVFGGHKVYAAWESKKFGRINALPGTIQKHVKEFYGDNAKAVQAIDPEKEAAIGWCPDCKVLVPARITEPAKRSANFQPENDGQCGSACLNGKRMCSCQCFGLCHGAGTCQCGNPTAAVAKKGLAKPPAGKAEAFPAGFSPDDMVRLEERIRSAGHRDSASLAWRAARERPDHARRLIA